MSMASLSLTKIVAYFYNIRREVSDGSTDLTLPNMFVARCCAFSKKMLQLISEKPVCMWEYRVSRYSSQL